MSLQDKKGFSICLIKYIIIILYQLIFYIIIKAFSETVNVDIYNRIYLFIDTGLSLLEMALLIFLFRDSLKKSILRFRSSLFYNTISIILMVCVYFFGIALVSLLFISQLTVNNQETVKVMNKTSVILNGIRTICLAPFIEEVFFRGILFQFLRGKNIILAFGFVNLLFALAHTWIQIISIGVAESWKAVLLYLFISIVITLFYCWRKNIWCAIFLHMSINIFAFLMINI